MQYILKFIYKLCLQIGAEQNFHAYRSVFAIITDFWQNGMNKFSFYTQ